MTRPADSTGRHRRFLARHRKLLDVALRLAENEGWDAVTTRRLAEAIDYSQPIVYQHFKNRDDLIRTLVVEGFVALNGRIDEAAGSSGDASLESLCRVYIDFGVSQPRLYEAMFTRSTTLPFAQPDTPPELRSAFDSLTALVADETPAGEAVAAAEFFWACCHGLVTLLNAGRIPEERLDQHIRRVVATVRLNGVPGEAS